MSCDGFNSPLSVEVPLNTLPKAYSTAGVSVDYVPNANYKWYVLRASYGREVKAADVMIEDGTYAYVARRFVRKQSGANSLHVFESLIPNMLFAYADETTITQYIKGSSRLAYLTLYYNHFVHLGDNRNPPLIIPNEEMENFVRATSSKNEHLMMVQPEQCRFKGGESVVVTYGAFKGVVGRVARVSGQQRVIVTLTSIGLVATAYIPTAFLKIYSECNIINQQ